MTPAADIEQLARATCRRVLGDVDRDPLSRTRGCFDRRYWAWKMADIPESTYQRNVFALAWWRDRMGERDDVGRGLLTAAVAAGLGYAAAIQHPDGSFDQAFFGEHSFGATAFLLFDLGRAAGRIDADLSGGDRAAVDDMLRQAAGFLCANDEAHGFIANHLAGAAAALTLASDRFSDSRYRSRADALLDQVISRQSDEGWFPEYSGADPGYQSLCVYYLACIHRFRPDPRLREALDRAIGFLSWFAHPGGGFGGEYGSRRTALLHAGGLAMMRGELPLADAMARFAETAIANGKTMRPTDIDAGNVAPLFMSYAALVENPPAGQEPAARLPFEQHPASRDFAAAGIAVRSTARYFAVLGASNGGVLKVYRQPGGECLSDDGGYVAEVKEGRIATTQVSGCRAAWEFGAGFAVVRAPFCLLPRELPTPWRFVLVRLFGLVLEALPGATQGVVREWFKRQLVSRLIAASRTVPMSLERRVTFTPDAVEVDDIIRTAAPTRVNRLERGAPFVGTHMASARYFPGFADTWPSPGRAALDASPLMAGCEVRSRVVVS